MKEFAKIVTIIFEVIAAIIIVPILGTLVAATVIAPIAMLPIIGVFALYVVLCHFINKGIFKNE